MSDLISTPSQTRSPVSNEAFESLIELLASDGIDGNPPKLPGDRPRSLSLRDPSGKLDFDKIRLMFAAQHESHRVSPSLDLFLEEKLEERASGMARDDSDSDASDEHYQSTSSVVPTRANSMSPKPVERPPAGHRRSSTFGNQPWTAIHENATPAIEDASPTVTHKPLSLDELDTALVGAHEEVKVLRQQYDTLRTFVSKRLGTETRDQAKLFPSTMDSEKVVPEKDNGGVGAGSQAQLTAVVPPAPVPSDVPTEIAGLSEIEAKRALAALARSLNLSPNVLAGLPNAPGPTSPQTLSPLDLTREHLDASITRAVKFLSTVDELVWRRTSAPSGPRTLSPVSSEANITALVARLDLWERTVRRSSRT